MMRTLQEPLGKYGEGGQRGIIEGSLDVKRASLKQPAQRAASIETAGGLFQ